ADGRIRLGDDHDSTDQQHAASPWRRAGDLRSCAKTRRQPPRRRLHASPRAGRDRLAAADRGDDVDTGGRTELGVEAGALAVDVDMDVRAEVRAGIAEPVAQ